jgi:hypothetical protein
MHPHSYIPLANLGRPLQPLETSDVWTRLRSGMIWTALLRPGVICLVPSVAHRLTRLRYSWEYASVPQPETSICKHRSFDK